MSKKEQKASSNSVGKSILERLNNTTKNVKEYFSKQRKTTKIVGEKKLDENRKEINLADELKDIETRQKNIEKKKTQLNNIDDKIKLEQQYFSNNMDKNDSHTQKFSAKEQKLNNLKNNRKKLQQEILTEEKIIEKKKKNIERKEKLEDIKKELYSIKKEVINEDETIFVVKTSENKTRNIFLISFSLIKSWILKNIFRKNVENYSNLKTVSKNIKVKIATSLILAVSLSICFFISLKFISSAKEQYAGFEEFKPAVSNVTEEMKKQKEKEEKERALEEQKAADKLRVDEAALDEEITAKLAGNFYSYSFNMTGQVTTTKKVHLFNRASWADYSEVIEPNTTFSVDYLVSPAGYMMYRISEGEHAGKYLTANEKFVKFSSNDKVVNVKKIAKYNAIKFLVTQNIYSNPNMTQVSQTISNGTVVNIIAVGVSDENRLIYYTENGGYIPVNPIKLTEVNREPEKKDNEDDKNNKDSKDKKNSTTTNKNNTGN